MLRIDGSFGEGGGQILRSALALSMVTHRPFRIEKIRAGRAKPGLMRQHLTAVQAAREISSAEVTGAAVGSTALTFTPGPIKPGEYAFSIGTAGSTTLVLQTVLPPLLCTAGTSTLTFEGGTHNMHAPPFDFLQKSFLRLINKMGPTVSATLGRPGFYPAGGGKFSISIQPATKLTGIDLTERGETRQRLARALVANLPAQIAEREVNVLRHRTSWPDDCFSVEEVKGSRGPGNIVLIELECEHVTEVFTGFGQPGVRAEAVAESAVQDYRRYLQADVAVGEYLADQLLLPVAIAGRGSFTTLPLSRHSMTHIELIGKFLEVAVTVEDLERTRRLVRVGRG